MAKAPTTWRDAYRPGSFRNAAFLTQSHEHELGRRGESHAFPFRDEPWFEDLGRKGRAWTISAFVIGPDYRTARDALLAALEAPGAGTLVHPFLGTFAAHVAGCRLSESTAEGGMARFDLSFVEPGVMVTAEVRTDTAGASKATSAVAKANAKAGFLASFLAAGQAGFVQLGSAQFLGTLSAQIAQAGGLLGGAGTVLRAFHSGLATLQGAASLLGQPARLADAMLGMIDALSQLGGQPQMQVAALQSVINSASAAPIGDSSTPANARLAANRQASIDLVVAGCAASAVDVIAGVAFASYDDAIAVRDRLTSQFDDAALAANGRGNRDLAESLTTLRRALAADVTARGGSLARLFAFTPPAVRPALAIAWSVYGDAAQTEQAALELASRNRVMHPLFVPASALQLPSADPVPGGSNG